MTLEQSFFIQILKDHLQGYKTKLDSGINWNTVASYARIHQVEGIVFYQCKQFLPPNVADLLNQKFSATLFYYKNRERAAKDIEKAFDKASIPFFIVKGMNIAACYPIPLLRTMGDLDIVVHEEDKTKADAVLVAMGYLGGEKVPDYDWGYNRNKIHVELHHQLFYVEPGRNRISRIQADFFNQCWNYVENGKLDWNFHFLFILAHLRKHLVNSGAGFRMFMDVAAMIKNAPGLNWEWIEETLRQLGMWKFSQICFALCERWYDVKAPLRFGEIDDIFAEEASEKTFQDGVFGFNNEDNRNNVAINSILTHGKARKLSRTQMVIHHLFPKYMHMRYIPYYSFIEGRPWLLPVAWIYRIVRLLSGKIDSMPSFSRKVRIPDSEVDAREEEMQRWGLFDEA